MYHKIFYFYNIVFRMSDYDSVHRTDDSEIDNVYDSDDDICVNKYFLF